ncbi:hypothetical protein P5624_00175 (plasmid) [Bacillus subtilis]|nr:hypothetical protein P5624_00175 [Bacillus subtilis]
MAIGLILNETSKFIDGIKMSLEKEYPIEKADDLLDQIDKTTLKNNDTVSVSFTIVDDGKELISEKITLNGSYFGLANYYHELLNDQTTIDDSTRFLKVLHVYNTIKIPLADNIEKYNELKNTAFPDTEESEVSSEVSIDEDIANFQAQLEDDWLHHQEAKRQAELEAQRKAEEEEAKRQAEFEAQRKAEEEEAKRQAEFEAQRKAEEEEAKRQAELEAQRKAEEEEAKRQAELEAQRKAEEEEAKRQAEFEAQRKAEEEEAKRQAELEAQRKAEEEAKRQAELEAQRKAEEEEAKRQAELEAQRKAEEEEAKRQAELEAQRKAEEEEAKRQAELEAQRKAEEEEAKRQAELEAQRKAEEEEAKRQAELEAQRKAEEEARKRKIKMNTLLKEESIAATQETPPAVNPQTSNKNALISGAKTGLKLATKIGHSSVHLTKQYIEYRKEKARLKNERFEKIAETTELLEREKIAFLNDLRKEQTKELKEKEKEIKRFNKVQDRYKKELARRKKLKYRHSSFGTLIKTALLFIVIIGAYIAYQKYSIYIPKEWLNHFK